MSNQERNEMVALKDVAVGRTGVQLTTLAEAYRFCETVHTSGIAPTSLNSAAKIFIAIQVGAEAGLSPMMSVGSIYVINGNAAWTGKAALGLIRKTVTGSCQSAPIRRNHWLGETLHEALAWRRRQVRHEGLCHWRDARYLLPDRLVAASR